MIQLEIKNEASKFYAYDYCENCQETIDYFISKCTKLATKYRNSSELKHKYKIGFKKYLQKFKKIDFDYEELKANHEDLQLSYNDLKEQYSKIQRDDEINKLKKDICTLKEENSKQNNQLIHIDNKVIEEERDFKLKFDDLVEKNQLLKEKLDNLEVKEVVEQEEHIIEEKIIKKTELSAQICNLTIKINDLSKEIELLSQEKSNNQVLTEELENLEIKRVLDDLLGSIDENQINEEYILMLENKNKKRKMRYFEIKFENENLMEIIDQLKENLKLSEEKNTKLLDDLSNISSRNQTEFDELIEKKSQLERDIFNLTVNINHSNEALYQRDRQIDSLKNNAIIIERDSRELMISLAKKIEDFELRSKNQEEKFGLEVRELKQLLIEARSAYEHEKEVNSNHVKEIISFQEVNCRFEKQVEQKEQIIEDKIIKITELNAQICNLTIKINDLSKEIELLSKEKSTKESDINELSIKLCDVHGENENLLKELLRSNNKINELEGKIKVIEGQLSSRPSMSSAAGLKISSTNLSESLMVKFDKFDRSFGDNGALQLKYDTLLDENAAKVKKIDELKHDNHKLKQHLKNEKDLAKKQAAKFEKEIAQLNKKIESMQKTNDYLTEQIDTLNQQFFELNNKENNQSVNKDDDDCPLKENKSNSNKQQQQQNLDNESFSTNNKENCAQQ